MKNPVFLLFAFFFRFIFPLFPFFLNLAPLFFLFSPTRSPLFSIFPNSLPSFLFSPTRSPFFLFSSASLLSFPCFRILFCYLFLMDNSMCSFFPNHILKNRILQTKYLILIDIICYQTTFCWFEWRQSNEKRKLSAKSIKNFFSMIIISLYTNSYFAIEIKSFFWRKTSSG